MKDERRRVSSKYLLRNSKALWGAGRIGQIVTTYLGRVGRDRFMQDTDLCKVQQTCHSAKHC